MRHRARCSLALLFTLWCIASCMLAAVAEKTSVVAPANWIAAGDLAVRNGNLELALQSFSKAIDANQGGGIAYYDRGQTYWRLGRYDEALTDVTRAIGLIGGFADGYELRARIEQAQGNTTAALSDADRAVALAPDVLRNRFERADVLSALSRDADAALDYEAILKRDPRSVLALGSLASIRAAQKRTDEAIQLLRRIDGVSAADADTVADTAALLVSASRYAEALTWIQAHPDRSPRIAELLSRALHGVHRDGEALVALPAASTADSSATDELRGSIFFALHRCTEAADEFEKASIAQPENVVVWRNMGAASGCAKNNAAALTAFTKAVYLDPSDATLHGYRADALMTGGDRKGAISEFTTQLRLSGDNASALKKLGVLEYLEGQHREGRLHFAKGCALLPVGATAARADCDAQLPKMLSK
jgi:tetratricopeptide (TPR) repeat protein